MADIQTYKEFDDGLISLYRNFINNVTERQSHIASSRNTKLPIYTKAHPGAHATYAAGLSPTIGSQIWLDTDATPQSSGESLDPLDLANKNSNLISHENFHHLQHKQGKQFVTDVSKIDNPAYQSVRNMFLSTFANPYPTQAADLETPAHLASDTIWNIHSKTPDSTWLAYRMKLLNPTSQPNYHIVSAEDNKSTQAIIRQAKEALRTFLGDKFKNYIRP